MQKGDCCSSNEAFRDGAPLLRAATWRLVSFLGSGFFAALLVLSPHLAAAASSDTAAPSDAAAAEASHPKHADYASENPSKEVRHIADWALDSGDNQGMPFAIVDKKAAKAYVFRPDGHLRGAAPVLIGSAKGDDSVPGIGDRELSDMPPEVRTTPAGRFVASLGRNASGKDILWVDYDDAISMHRVINTNPKERRPYRLATPTPLDNRISYGCINVPFKFFDDVVLPAFEGTNGIVYILPEVHPIQRVFAKAYDVDERARTQTAGDPPAAPMASAAAPVAAPPMPTHVSAATQVR
jgi:hypothetical protein